MTAMTAMTTLPALSTLSTLSFAVVAIRAPLADVTHTSIVSWPLKDRNNSTKSLSANHDRCMVMKWR